MKKLDTQTLMTGFFAGVTTALLVLGANAQPSFSAFLYAASAMPVLIAGLGWGNIAAITATVTAAALGAILVSPSFALVMTVVTLAPAGWLSHLANLGGAAGGEHAVAVQRDRLREAVMEAAENAAAGEDQAGLVHV